MLFFVGLYFPLFFCRPVLSAYSGGVLDSKASFPEIAQSSSHPGISQHMFMKGDHQADPSREVLTKINLLYGRFGDRYLSITTTCVVWKSGSTKA